MGKRRDRRHAVLGGGGRRMKLDLRNDDEVAAEGKNMSISTTVEEGGEKTGVESDERLSPQSLPGPVQVNPLSLLGQYSDEDEDGGEQMLANGSSGGVSAGAIAGQVDEQVASFLADLETSGLLKDEIVSDEDRIDAEGDNQAKSPQGTKISEGNDEVDTKEKEVTCEWEAVLHKESSEYYYWNKVTGETTWDKPATYAESKAKEGSDLHDGVQEDSKRPLEDPHSRSKTVPEVVVEEVVSTIDDAAIQELKDNIYSDERSVGDFVEGDQLKDSGSEVMPSEHAVNQDAACDNEDGKETDICLETRESSEMIDCSAGKALKDQSELQGDPGVTASASVIGLDAGDSCKVEDSMTLNIVENGEGAEDISLAVGSTLLGAVECHPSTVDLAGATGVENLDTKSVVEETKRYDHRRLLERGEVLAQNFQMLAGEALRCLSLRLRLVVESEVRLSDCKAMAMHDLMEDHFWEHMDSQIARLEARLLVEQAAASLEVEKQMFTSSVDHGKHHSRTEGDMHGVQDMDVDMDVDMEHEDQNNVGTSAAARSVDHDVSSDLPLSLLYSSTVPQPLVYSPTPALSQGVSYGLIQSLPPEVTYISPAQPLPPLSESPLFPVAPLFPRTTSVFPVIQSSLPSLQADSWVPPPPPEEEWVPPPLPDQEAPPPPPDEDEFSPHPPLDMNSHVVLPPNPHPSSVAPVGSSSVYYPVVANQLNQENIGSERHDANCAEFGSVDGNTGSIHINGNVLPPSVVSTGAAETTTKKSNKVRSKKRSHSTAVGASLMSNKKVSSLVNKWLAAQEELHSSDEEEEDKDLFDVEALEKKRQKEIEEWRHQTLASGGALENANFQPLGTLDWRERVKRAKKEASKLAAKQAKEAKTEELKTDLINGSDESNLGTDIVAASTPPKRPDLKELTKDLPSGWQAFWDAESCEVYYGNLTTSETSWDRPL